MGRQPARWDTNVMLHNFKTLVDLLYAVEVGEATTQVLTFEIILVAQAWIQ